MSFQQAFDNARSKGNRYFWYNGKYYNTKRRYESDQYWASHFKDNSTSGGSSDVQTDVGLSGGWEGKKGANAGRYNSQGKWTKFRTDLQGEAPVGLRGDDTTQSRAYGNVDKPTDAIYTFQERGTDRGQGHQNSTTQITVGMPGYAHTPGTVESGSFAANRQYAPGTEVQFYPWGFNGGSGSYVISPLTPGINQPNWNRYNGVKQYFDAGTIPTVEVKAKAPKGVQIKPYIE